ncbi:unnamed protein product, partial [Brassica napus]
QIWLVSRRAVLLVSDVGDVESIHPKTTHHNDLDIAGTLAAEDAGQVAKLRSVLESVDHKRRKILQQMRGDAHLLNLEEGSPPIQPKFFSPIHHKMWR